jgi:hypothetical protein
MMPGIMGGPSGGPRIDPKKLDLAIESGLKRKEITSRFLDALAGFQSATFALLQAYRMQEEVKLADLSHSLSELEAVRQRLQSSIVVPGLRPNA